MSSTENLDAKSPIDGGGGGGGDYEYGLAGGEEDIDEYRPSIVLMGLKRSGKTSIRKVVFQKMSPNETLFVESTSRVTSESVKSSFVDFDTKEFPGQLSPFDSALDPQHTFSRCGAVVFVIDPMDDYTEALHKLNDYVVRAYKINPNIRFEVFIHKVDGLPEENKLEIHREIFQRANDDLVDAGMDQIHLSFHLTSIYDHSIFEAFSKVVQKLIPQLPTLENLLVIFNRNSLIEKSFLFDVSSKIYVATDGTPVHMATYELCCDMIDVVLDISCIYGSREEVAKGDADAASDAQVSPGFDAQSASIIRLNTNQVLYLRQVNKYLALVCIIRSENFEKQGMIEHNFTVFKNAIDAVFRVRAAMLERQRRAIANGMSIAEATRMPNANNRIRRTTSNDTIGSGSRASS